MTKNVVIYITSVWSKEANLIVIQLCTCIVGANLAKQHNFFPETMKQEEKKNKKKNKKKGHVLATPLGHDGQRR